MKATADLFTVETEGYVAIDTYFSNLKFDINNPSHKLKAHFARYGIPDKIETENDWHEFAIVWGIAPPKLTYYIQ